MSYKIRVSQRIEKRLAKIPKRIALKIRDGIATLKNDPRPPNAKKLKGHRSWYRIRFGDYRVVYEVIDSQLVIILIEIAPRGAIYSLLKQLG